MPWPTDRNGSIKDYAGPAKNNITARSVLESIARRASLPLYDRAAFRYDFNHHGY